MGYRMVTIPGLENPRHEKFDDDDYLEDLYDLYSNVGRSSRSANGESGRVRADGGSDDLRGHNRRPAPRP